MDELPLNDELKKIFKQFLETFKREIEEGILTDILSNLYFLECNKPCNYEKMTPEEIVTTFNDELKKIETRYNFDLARELGLYDCGGDDDYY